MIMDEHNVCSSEVEVQRFALYSDVVGVQFITGLGWALVYTSSRYDQYSSEHIFCCIRAQVCSCTHKIKLHESQLYFHILLPHIKL